MEIVRIDGIAAVLCPAEGAPLGSEQDALDLMAEGYEEEARLIVIPVERMAEDFFRLRTGKLGAFLQKLTNYGCEVAFIGDLSAQLAESQPLRDFVYESNKGGRVRFVASSAELGIGR
jgi:hypothetical protein